MKKVMFLGLVIGVVFLTQFIEQYSSRPDVLTQGTQVVEIIES
ncbi:NprX family peptide pheromone [Bacillus cereus]|nr:NprX family peptide pheromone [Bacillus cereus]